MAFQEKQSTALDPREINQLKELTHKDQKKE